MTMDGLKPPTPPQTATAPPQPAQERQTQTVLPPIEGTRMRQACSCRISVGGLSAGTHGSPSSGSDVQGVRLSRSNCMMRAKSLYESSWTLSSSPITSSNAVRAIASFVWILEHFVLEGGVVESKTEVDWVSHGQVLLDKLLSPPVSQASMLGRLLLSSPSWDSAMYR